MMKVEPLTGSDRRCGARMQDSSQCVGTAVVSFRGRPLCTKCQAAVERQIRKVEAFRQLLDELGWRR